MRIEGVELEPLAGRVETPFYCYSAAVLSDAYDRWCRAFEQVGFGKNRQQVCFAVKANGALAVLHHLAARGVGFDIISEGELRRVLTAGGDPSRIVFSGPGKTPAALACAVEAGVGLINVEVPDEIDEILDRDAALAGPAGLLITRVVAIRERPDRTLLICDAGMNTLLRPALYGAPHQVSRVNEAEGPERRDDVVGPLCEAGDVLAEGAYLPTIEVGDLLAVGQVGAYGNVMASEYNARPRPAQVWVEGDRWAVISARREIRQMLREEMLAPWQGQART